MVSAHRLTTVDLLRIVDIRTKIVSVSSSAIGTAFAAAQRHVFAPAAFVLMLAATLCVDMGTSALNSYRDFLHGVDTHDTDVERCKSLVRRGAAPGFAHVLGPVGAAGAIVPRAGFTLAILGGIAMRTWSWP